MFTLLTVVALYKYHMKQACWASVYLWILFLFGVESLLGIKRRRQFLCWEVSWDWLYPLCIRQEGFWLPRPDGDQGTPDTAMLPTWSMFLYVSFSIWTGWLKQLNKVCRCTSSEYASKLEIHKWPTCILWLPPNLDVCVNMFSEQ